LHYQQALYLRLDGTSVTTMCKPHIRGGMVEMTLPSDLEEFDADMVES